MNPDIISLFSYKDSLIKKILWKLKYHQSQWVARPLGALLYDRLIEEIADKKDFLGSEWVLVPVPMSKKRLKKRGHNHSVILARAIVEEDKEGIFRISSDVIKSRETTPQARVKNREIRLKNIKNSFAIHDSSSMDGRTV